MCSCQPNQYKVWAGTLLRVCRVGSFQNCLWRCQTNNSGTYFPFPTTEDAACKVSWPSYFVQWKMTIQTLQPSRNSYYVPWKFFLTSGMTLHLWTLQAGSTVVTYTERLHRKCNHSLCCLSPSKFRRTSLRQDLRPISERFWDVAFTVKFYWECHVPKSFRNGLTVTQNTPIMWLSRGTKCTIDILIPHAHPGANKLLVQHHPRHEVDEADAGGE